MRFHSDFTGGSYHGRRRYHEFFFKLFRLSYEQHDPADPRNKSRAGTSPARHGGQGVDFLTVRAPRPHGAKKGWNDESPGGTPPSQTRKRAWHNWGYPTLPSFLWAYRATHSKHARAGGGPSAQDLRSKGGTRHTLASPARSPTGRATIYTYTNTGTPTNPAASRRAHDRAQRQRPQPAAAAAAQRSSTRAAGL